MLSKIPRIDNRLFVIILIAAIIFIAILYYDSSPISYNSYNTICTSNYGKISEYNDCMQPFYNQWNMDMFGIYSATFVLIATTLIYLTQRLKKTT